MPSFLHPRLLYVVGKMRALAIDSLRLLELYPRSTYVVLDRGTHGLPIDETSVFEALVRDWINRVNEWRGRTDREV